MSAVVRLNRRRAEERDNALPVRVLDLAVVATAIIRADCRTGGAADAAPTTAPFAPFIIMAAFNLPSAPPSAPPTAALSFAGHAPAHSNADRPASNIFPHDAPPQMVVPLLGPLYAAEIQAELLLSQHPPVFVPLRSVITPLARRQRWWKLAPGDAALPPSCRPRRPCA